MRNVISNGLPKLVARIGRRLPFHIGVKQSRPHWPGEKDRYSYQSQYVEFDIHPGDRVLDIGSGAYPFPHASVLMDHYVETTAHRTEALVTNGKPFLLSDVHALPFPDHSFDFVYCSHLLEHVGDPIRACSEIMRIGRRGFVETPTYAKDALFAWADGMHKWHVVSIADVLVFFEYSKRQLQGVRSKVWRNIISDRYYHPLQKLFFENQDSFNTMLLWNGAFKVVVFRLDGKMTTLGL